jgi:hypothetical protein
MLEKLSITVDSKKLFDLVKHFPEGKNQLNTPTGDFFYDAWTLLPEYQNTEMEELLKQLPNHGEARVIVLKPGESYSAHADIDDRYHVTLDAEQSYLHDVENEIMYATKPDNTVYLMNTGVLHTASNYGYKNRYQLVIRKLLQKQELHHPINVFMNVKEPVYNLRYLFDSSFSKLLNRFNKQGKITKFSKVNECIVKFIVEESSLNEILKMQQTCGFDVEVVYG